jgi:type VI secretion system protein
MSQCVRFSWLAILISCALVSCSIPRGVVRKTTGLASGKLSLEVTISPAANQNSPVAVDVLFIKDKAFLKTIQGMPASEWFSKKAQWQPRTPKAFELKQWEWVPGQQVQAIAMPVGSDVKGVVMFARYSTPGPHIALMPSRGRVCVSLNEQDFSIDCGP